jgi:hypothetical protein
MMITSYTFDDRPCNRVYTGERLAGRVRDVLLGGRALVRQGRFVGTGTAGAYLPAQGAAGSEAAAP